MTWLDYLKSFSSGRQRLRDKVVSHDPTAGMRSNVQFFGSEVLVDQLPPFTLRTGRLMLRSDPIVSFALNVRNAALMVAEVEITAKSGQVQTWVQEQWNTLWNKHRNKLLSAKQWGFAPLQVVLKEKHGLVVIDDVKDFAPEDCRALECGGKVAGFKIRDRKVFQPQAMWLSFNAEYGSPYGAGCFRRMYPPWYEKWTDHGAKKLLQLRMLKDAYIGDIFFYPHNQLVDIPRGDGTVQRISWRDVAREIGENRLSGSAMFLPMVQDDKGNKLLDYLPPQAVPGGTEIFQWNDSCDENILRGADVPMEVIKASETGSGFSGRSIPFMVVLSVCTGELTEVIEGLTPVLRSLAWLNWGGDQEFEIKPKSLVESFAADAGGSPMGGGAIGGQPGQRPQNPGQPPQAGHRMGWVGNDGQVTQFDEQDERWITIGGRKEGEREHAGGFPVQIDANGRIVKSGGPQGLVGRHVSESGGYFAGERRNAAREQEVKDWAGRKGWNTVVARQAARWKIDPDAYESIADQVWADRMQQHGEREAAKKFARQRLKLNAGDIERLENQGLDSGSKHDRIKAFDTVGREMANMFPALGWGEGYGSGDDRDYGSDLWELIREGKQELPSRTSQDYHAAVDDHLSAEWDRHKKRKQTLVDNEPIDDSQFSEHVRSLAAGSCQFDDVSQPVEEIASLAAMSARARIRGAASRIRALKKNDLTPLPTLAIEIEREILALHRGLSADLAASMLGGQVTGMADAWATMPAEVFIPPPSAPAAPPAPPQEPPSIADLLGPDEPTPGARFPVVDDALAVLAEAPAVSRPDFRATAEAVKEGAFAITGDLTEAAVADVRDILVENLAKGPDREAFIDTVIERLGEGGPLSEARIENIFRTNTAAAMSDGTEKALAHPLVVDAFPYRAYWATTDQRVRRSHIALEKLGLDGTNIYRADDPAWVKFRPPWDFQCRCSWSPVSVEQATRRGVREAQEWLERAKAMAAELGGSEYEYFTRTAPAATQWVSPPPFNPSPEFQRK